MRHGKFKVPSGHDRYTGKTVYYTELDGTAEYTALCESMNLDGGYSWAGDFGGEHEKFMEELRSGGTTKYAKLIQKARIGIDVPAFRTYGQTVAMSVGAGVPIIPAVLAGIPEHVLSVADHASMDTPVRIIVDRGTSWCISEYDVTRAGATIAAVAEIIQGSRALEIYVVDSGGALYTPEGTNPVPQGFQTGAASLRLKLNPHASAAEIGFFLVGESAIRRGLYSISQRFYGNASCWAFRTPDSFAACVSDFSLPTDILVRPMFEGHPLAADPTRWAKEALDKAFAGIEED